LLRAGTDITEAVETHLDHARVMAMLNKYRVRPAKTPGRRYATFDADGFYATMRRRAHAVLAHVPGGVWPGAGSSRVVTD
jgi:hypothetical protein